ncbi:amidohydrolase family protein [Spiractinospora alimapuensis]|uniref:amidohydrolase family protein n=1 Tax=Spiractinospora alimapuensis TaxID=2820884 RepID=UPI001F22F03D|nr:amidohydrolase family protein [Spiractinospora alimapuensis]QVQ50050.1 amidohydrolase family protein [Spiractinospora alimapuensis]
MTERARVVDTHHHFWTAEHAAGNFPAPRYAPLHRDATPEQLEHNLRVSGVGASVVVQTANTLDHTRALLRIHAEHDFVAGVCGWLPLHDPDATRQALAELGHPTALRGVRHLARHHSLTTPEPDPTSRAGLDALQVLADHDLSYDLVCVSAEELRAAAALAAERPQLRLVLDHLGRPPADTGAWEPWASAIAEVAAQPNTTLKVSAGVHLLSAWNRWAPPALAPYVEHVRHLFGADRLMMASNWPVTRLVARYGDIATGVRGLFADWTPSERVAVEGATAERVYRLARRA